MLALWFIKLIGDDNYEKNYTNAKLFDSFIFIE